MKYINSHVSCARWAKAFKANVEDKNGAAAWKLNMDGLHQNM